ncbi:hypothetical protein HMPREF1246_2191 [Acidaminococcus sp. BV3L6]|nr:hypothetical protein HMPREF1246_2191 [Acidaminococcus sp. BV3L6]
MSTDFIKKYGKRKKDSFLPHFFQATGKERRSQSSSAQK